jgi:F-type H+-transporting ATPase subunit epsilon
MSQEKTMRFELVTPERVVLKEDVFQITIPTKSGEITVLPGHIPLVSILAPGVIELKTLSEKIEIISVSSGFLEVSKDKVIILADTAERGHEIDEKRIGEAKKKAEDLKKNAKVVDDVEFTKISALLDKELARDKALKKWKKIKNIESIN